VKTRFDDQCEMVCVRDCFYAGTNFTAGRSVILGSHPALHHLAEHFEPLTAENTPKRSSTLREQLERRANRVEELDQHAAAERVRVEQEKSRRALASEDAFWERSAELLETRVFAADLPDPAAEEIAEKRAQEERIAALPEDDERFWDETMTMLERPRGLGGLEDPDEW